MKTLSILFLVFTSIWADKERVIDGAASNLRHHLDDHDSNHHQDHQAILGSRKAAQEFDELPAQDAKNRLQVLANQRDLNKDGSIDHNELIEWIMKSMKMLDEEEVEERIKELDTNNDGFITWEEYTADNFPDGDRLDEDDKKLMKEDELYFKAADLNKDQKLSREEFAAFLNPENYPHMYETLVEVTLWEKDLNKDNAIDIREFLGDMAENPQSEWYTVEKNRFMEEYDENKDGFLKGDEVRRWLIPDMRKVAEQEGKHLMEGADTNKDGILSLSEIVDAHKLFVGSEATNYGEDLHKLENAHSEL